MIRRVQLDLPPTVSGRPVTNRGVHLQPFGYHGDWLNRAKYWTDLLVSMGMSWAVLLTEGDSVRQTYHGLNPLAVLLDAGVIPIIREQARFPDRFSARTTVEWTVDLYGRYGLKPLWIIRNEPFDEREWAGGHVPPDAWDVVMRVWGEAAAFIASQGGCVGFPDGPGYSFNPFESIKAHGLQWVFDEGLGFYAGHHYGKNRHRDFPYDAVTRYGARLTEEAYRRLLDDFAADPAWRDEPTGTINRRRSELRSAGLTPLQDDTCWRGWEKIVQHSLASFGYVVPMAMTEGGWVPRDRPGSGPDTDIRVPYTTPRMVAKRTLQMYDVPSPFFAICPWLLADEDMGGSGWPFDAWHGWAHSEKYGRSKPVIKLLQQVRPKEVEARSEPAVIDVEGDTRDWVWVEETYGGRFRRGEGPARLIEVHEYEGPESVEAWVVDGAGLPVEGVAFYYYHPEAPPIPREQADSAVDEWYDRGVAGTTSGDGRVSFAVSSGSETSGLEHRALWPRGRGDVLDGVGALPGAGHRHLNGLWQWAEAAPEVRDREDPSSPPAAPPAPAGAVDPWAAVMERMARIEELVGRLK